ncbi:phosphonate C-P lyase system protein PhnH [Microbacterium sp. gxy059]|uniref:phosphonate C-P lyase system protein PhnH n=1 Tax=Microbacterium sp. gxy059 TaxID=2957199 RepID=UPI003D96AECE
MTEALHTPGFSAPVRDAQRVFRAVLEAMSRPARPHPVDPGVAPPAPLGPLAGAIVLALADAQTPVWLDPALTRDEAAARWIRFHTGAPIVADAWDAAFAIASCPSAAPRLDELSAGTDEEPHLSATLVIDASDARPTGDLVATGPGVDGSLAWDGAGLPAGFLPQWRENGQRFPRGVDVLLAGRDGIVGLPRTTRLENAEAR